MAKLLFGEGAGNVELSSFSPQKKLPEWIANLRKEAHGGGWAKGWMTNSAGPEHATITFDEPNTVSQVRAQLMYATKYKIEVEADGKWIEYMTVDARRVK